MTAPRRPAAAAWAMASTWSARRYVADSQRSASMAVAVSTARSNAPDAAAVGERLGAVGVGADELGLAVPQPGQVDGDLAGHAHHHDPTAGPGDGERGGQRRGGADGVDRGVGPGRQLVADDVAADDAPHRPRQLAGRDDVVGAEGAGEALLVRVAGADDDARVGRVAHESGDRGEAHRAGAEDGDDRLGGRVDGRRAGGHQGGVDAAGERLDEHGPLVGHVVGDRVELAVVGPEPRRPAAAGRAAEAGLDAGLEASRRQVGVVVAVGRRGALERRGEAAGGVTEHRFEHDARAVVELADDLVAGHEREAHPVVEVRRRVALDHRQVAAADPGEARVHPLEARSGQLRVVDLGEVERPDPHRGGRRQRRRDPGQPEPPDRPLHLQRLHARASPPSEYLGCIRVRDAGQARIPYSDGARYSDGRDVMRTAGGARARPSAGRTGAADAARRWPSTSARRASRACGRWPPGGSRG